MPFKYCLSGQKNVFDRVFTLTHLKLEKKFRLKSTEGKEQSYGLSEAKTKPVAIEYSKVRNRENLKKKTNKFKAIDLMRCK